MHMCIHIHTIFYTLLHVHTHTYILQTNIHTHTYKYTYITYYTCTIIYSFIHVYSCKHTYFMHTLHIHTYRHTYIYIYIFINSYMHTLCAHTYIAYIHIKHNIKTFMFFWFRFLPPHPLLPPLLCSFPPPLLLPFFVSLFCRHLCSRFAAAATRLVVLLFLTIILCWGCHNHSTNILQVHISTNINQQINS